MKVLLCCLVGLVGLGDHRKFLDDILRGLEGPFRVVIDITNEEDSPLTSGQLKTITELHLRKLGLPVADGEEGPVLAVALNVTSIETTDDEVVGFCYSMSVKFFDMAKLLSSGRIILVPVWDRITMGYFGREGRHALRTGLGDMLDAFANAWLKTHPPEPSKKKPPDEKNP